MARRFIFSVLLSVLAISAFADITSINIDTKTAEAMTAGYATEFFAEGAITDEITQILKHYTSSEVASAGIFSSKWLDRQALKESGRFGHAERNYYYRRIYQLVSAQIMPKIYNVAVLCIKYPEKALYWGPYLFKVTEEVKQLCMQFEVVVCNGKITFQDIMFFCISDQFKDMFNLLTLGDVDWKSVLDKMGDFGENLTKEDLSSDMDGLLRAGTAIASAGSSLVTDTWSNLSSSTRKAMSGKVDDLIRAYNDFDEVFQLVSNPSAIKEAVLQKLVTTDSTGVANLLSVDSYNIGRYISDYVSSAQGQYYKQRWYIVSKNSGTEVLCDYSPPTGTNNIIRSPEWVLYTYDQLRNISFDYILHNSESYAGWSQSQVDALNRQHPDETYRFDKTQIAYSVYNGYGSTQSVAFAYKIRVTHSWNSTEEAYSETFDSYDMNINTFLAKMNAKVLELNSNQTVTTSDGISMDSPNPRVYYLESDEKQYYTESDERKMQGCESVSYTLNCSGSNELGEGNFSWKENGDHNHKDIRDDSRRYAMESTLSGVPPLDEIDAKIEEFQSHSAEIQQAISALDSRNKELYALINSESAEDKESLLTEYNDNAASISTLQSELSDINKQLENAISSKSEMVEEYSEEEDGTYRIPAVMHELETAYQISWSSSGSWSGSTFVRKGTIQGFQRGEVTFLADLTCSRGESHFLGIRTHRAILNIHWSLTADYSSSDVIEVMSLDPNMSDAEKNEKVNSRFHELQHEYPDCTVDMEYAYAVPEQVADDDDSPHLLWVSDRLQIARNIEYRLARIYANLVLTEKFLKQRDSVLSYFKHQLFGGLPEGAKSRFGGKSFRRWRHAASHIASGRKPDEIEILDDENYD